YQAAFKPEGDYIYYSHIKLTTPDKESPKVSYIYGILDLQWIVGAGVYLDDVETDISQMRAKLTDQIQERLLYYILTVIGIVALFFLFFNRLNRGLRNDFNLFVSFFNRAAHSDKEIDRDAIKFIELDQMAEYANKMLTERRQAEEALRKSEEKYKLITETSQTGIYIHQDDIIIYANDRFAELHGYTVSELIGTIYFELFHSDGKERGREIKSKRLRGDADTPQYHEARHIKKDGGILWCQTVAVRIEYQGKPAILGNLVDITERKRAEESQRENEEKYRRLFELESDAIFLIDKDSGKILEVNASAADLYGFSREELLQMRNVDLSAEADKTKQATQNQHTRIPMRYHRKKDGTVFPVEITASHFYWKGREAHIAAIRDITLRVEAESARSELEKELYHARKMESIGTLTGGIAHDFNNILGIIVGNTELALMDVPNWVPAHANLQAIKTASLRATKIVKQLLSFSRKTDQKLQPIEIALVIKDALKFLRSMIPSTIEIQQHIQTTDETILADPTQVNQIMMNLCINASQAMEQTGGVLSIRVENIILDEDSAKSYPDLGPGKYVGVSISDTGPGIAPEIIDRIFEPYFTTKEIGKGSGMGLAVVHGIVKNHNGAISVDSRIGKGASFTVLFPTAAEKPLTEINTSEEIPHGNESILFIDDEESVVNMTRRMLERLGYMVEARINPVEALAQFHANPDRFDLVITDMTMPKMTGLTLSEKIMEIRPDMPVIICTGHSALVDEEKAKGLGIAAYVMKPVNMTEMAKTIRRVLDEAKIQPTD
ncbi:MAG: PAS domain S-box protein, partial [Thermodesulfobacteriota bacterium]